MDGLFKCWRARPREGTLRKTVRASILTENKSPPVKRIARGREQAQKPQGPRVEGGVWW